MSYMNRVIGRKSIKIGLLYGTFACLGIFVLIELLPAIFQGGHVDVIPLAIVSAFEFICFVISFFYFKVPMKPIIQKSYEEIYLPGYKKSVFMSEITDISCKRARARGGYFNWGTILISTKEETYKLRFMADCENTATILHRLKGDQKYIG